MQPRMIRTDERPPLSNTRERFSGRDDTHVPREVDAPPGGYVDPVEGSSPDSEGRRLGRVAAGIMVGVAILIALIVTGAFSKSALVIGALIIGVPVIAMSGWPVFVAAATRRKQDHLDEQRHVEAPRPIDKV